MKLVYIAGQYRGITPERTELNIQAAKHMGALVAELGLMPVIPHTNTAGFEDYVINDQQFWLDGTMELMRRCDAVVFIQGWKMSDGARGEYKVAVDMGLPVFESIEGVFEWGEL